MFVSGGLCNEKGSMESPQQEWRFETMVLNQLGIFGWKAPDEDLLLSSLLTGDPSLLFGDHGCAKTSGGRI